MSPMTSFHDLTQSENPEDRIAHDFLIVLLTELFGKSDQIRIDMETESERNHAVIKKHWKSIRIYYGVPDSAKYAQKCVRQTLIQIITRINQKYGLTQPLKMEHKRSDFYQKGKGKVTDYWIELSFV